MASTCIGMGGGGGMYCTAINISGICFYPILDSSQDHWLTVIKAVYGSKACDFTTVPPRLLI